MKVEDADAFYTTMGALTQEMLESSVLNADSLVKVRAHAQKQVTCLHSS